MEVIMAEQASSQTVLITGESRCLGIALTRELAQRKWYLLIDARGADAPDRTRAELAKHTHEVAIVCDVADSEHRRSLTQAAEELGGLDAIVNIAGILGTSPQPEMVDYPLGVLEQVYRINVVAPLGVIQAVRHVLKPGARIIKIISDAAV